MEEFEINLAKSLANLLVSPRNIYVACSGGVDSMALLSLIYRASKSLNFQPTILHVNYGLRGQESDGDEQHLRRIAQDWSLKIQVLDLKSEAPPKSGIQEWAREKRYKWFDSLLKKEDLIAIAHNQGDVAENVLLRLSRGVGQSLAGLQEYTGKYWRPLLNIPRTQLCEYLIRQKVPHREDSSNVKIDYSRNKVRHRVIPILEEISPQASKKIAQTAFEIDEILFDLDNRNQDIWDRETLNGESLREFIPAMQVRLISLYLRKKIPYVELSRELLHSVCDAAITSGDLTRELKGCGKVKVKDGVILVQLKEAFTEYAKQYRRVLAREPKVILGKGSTLVTENHFKNDGEND